MKTSIDIADPSAVAVRQTAEDGLANTVLRLAEAEAVLRVLPHDGERHAHASVACAYLRARRARLAAAVEWAGAAMEGLLEEGVWWWKR